MKPTQAERVLTELRRAGDSGVHSFSLRRQHYIGNPSERVRELERQGHVVNGVRERLHGEAFGVRWFLTFDAGDPEPVKLRGRVAAPRPSETSLGAPAVSQTLFDLPVPVAGAYDRERAA